MVDLQNIFNFFCPQFSLGRGRMKHLGGTNLVACVSSDRNCLRTRWCSCLR
jgi:hypothetical protein